MEDIDPAFVSRVQTGDILVGRHLVRDRF
jgi:hypothetical protein